MSKADHQQCEHGAALPAVAFVVAVMVVMSLLLGAVAQRVVDRARAQAGADAAALAAVVEGRTAAMSLAAANGVSIVEFDEDADRVVVVVVTPSGIRARATAERVLAPSSGG